MLELVSTDIDSIDMLDSTDKDDASMTNDLNSKGTGISPLQTSVMMMASFRVDREVWAKFGAIAKRERLTATDVLTDYIQKCTDNDRTEYDANTGNDAVINTSIGSNDAVMTMVNTAIDKALEELVRINVKPLADRLAELETCTRN